MPNGSKANARAPILSRSPPVKASPVGSVMVLGSTVGTVGGGAEVGDGTVVDGGVTVVPKGGEHVTQNTFCFVSAPIDPSASTVSLTWNPSLGWGSSLDAATSSSR